MYAQKNYSLILNAVHARSGGALVMRQKNKLCGIVRGADYHNI